MTEHSPVVVLQEEIRQCHRCRELGLIHQHETGRWAYPVLQNDPPLVVEVMGILEAPNASDTFDESKGHLTFDSETDPSGRFTRELFESVGIAPDAVLFTNTVLCLPARRGERHPVSAKQRSLCQTWLVKTIEAANPKVVVTFGQKALTALNRIERHSLTLRTGVGKLHEWFGRKLLPLYHPGLLGRISRSREQQLRDIRAILPISGQTT